MNTCEKMQRLQVQADKVLQMWRRDAVFDSYALAEFEVLSLLPSDTSSSARTIFALKLESFSTMTFSYAGCQEILKKGRASTASKHEKRKAEKQEPSQGPQGANGDMDMDFGITYEDDPAPPLPVAPPPSR